jgi:hypothetical protein
MNYYEALNISQNSTVDEINQAFRICAKKYHPDLNKEIDAKEKFIYIYEAYSILKDYEKRKIYDETLNIKYYDIHEPELKKWKNDAKEEGKYYSENNYEIFVNNVLEKLLSIGKTTVEVTGVIGLTIIIELVNWLLSLILKGVMYLLPVIIIGFLFISISLGFRQEFIPLAIIALILNIWLTVFIHKKLKKHNITLD